jgi:DNA-binding transcriptional ArsR family regulator
MKNNKSLNQMQKNSLKAESMLKMLANANRLMILCHLVKGEKTVSELLELLDISQSALSQHLAKMRKEKILDSRKCSTSIYYRICNFEVESILHTLYLIYCK